MKWIPLDPPALLEGMIGLNGEERGFYCTVIALLYARKGKNVTDTLVCAAMACRPQVWRRVHPQLIHKGKIWRQEDGSWMANRVQTTLETVAKRMSLTRGFRLQQLKNQELKFAPTYGQPQPDIILPWRGTARGRR